MKAKPVIQTTCGYKNCEAEEATHVWLWMPGPLRTRILPVVHGNSTRKGTNCWSWNGDTEKTTLRPSILTKNHEYVCHSWVNDGKAQFLDDCNHDLAGEIVELLDVEVELGW